MVVPKGDLAACLALTWLGSCTQKAAAQPLSPHYRREHRAFEAAMFRNSYQARVSPRVRCWVWLSPVRQSSEVTHLSRVPDSAVRATQGGFLSLLYSIGSKPLQLWDKQVQNGHIKRLTDEDIQSSVLEILGANVRHWHWLCRWRPGTTSVA
jgi:Protein of unknown function (DUF667)